MEKHRKVHDSGTSEAVRKRKEDRKEKATQCSDDNGRAHNGLQTTPHNVTTHDLEF